MSIQKRRFLKWILLTIIILLFYLCGVLQLSWIFAPSSVTKAEMLLRKDEKLLEKTMLLISEMDEYVYSHRLFSPPGDYQNEELNQCLVKLHWRGYKIISRNGNTVAFTRWIRWKDFGAGLAYTFDETNPPSVEYLRELEGLSKNGWYYYESN